MSRPRYTSAESTLTSSTGKRSASAQASAVLPVAVGPIRKIADGRRSMLFAWCDMAAMVGSARGVPLAARPIMLRFENLQGRRHAEHDEGAGQARRRQGIWMEEVPVPEYGHNDV